MSCDSQDKPLFLNIMSQFYHFGRLNLDFCIYVPGVHLYVIIAELLCYSLYFNLFVQWSYNNRVIISKVKVRYCRDAWQKVNFNRSCSAPHKSQVLPVEPRKRVAPKLTFWNGSRMLGETKLWHMWTSGLENLLYLLKVVYITALNLLWLWMGLLLVILE